MRSILFNYIYYPIEANKPQKKTKMLLYLLKDIPEIDYSKYEAFVQMFNNGRMMCKDIFDINYWNGCTYEDIDYKVYYNNVDNATDPLLIYNSIQNYIFNNYKDVIYYCEISKSNKGFHFIFYFNVPKTMNNFRICKAISKFIVKKAFKECGYENELNYEGVYDNCTDSIFQRCYITFNNAIYNEYCTGNCIDIVNKNHYAIKKEYEPLEQKARNKQKQLERAKKRQEEGLSNDLYEINYEVDDDSIKYDKINYLDHHQRWHLFCSLSGLCGDDEQRLIEEWERCARLLPEENGHNTNYYIHVPWKLDWARSRTGDEYIDTELLNIFGYTIKFIPKNKYGESKDQRASKEIEGQPANYIEKANIKKTRLKKVYIQG